MATFDKDGLVDTATPDSRSSLPTTRRVFLKALGVTAIGTVAGSLPIPPLLTPVSAAPAAPPPESIEKALTIAKGAAMFQEISTDLQAYEFAFDVSFSAVHHSSANGVFVGFVLRHSRSSSRRTGADVIVTVNLSTEQLTVVQFVTGWCLVDAMQVSSTVLDIRAVPYEESRPSRIHFSEPPRLVRPRTTQLHRLERANPRPLKPEEIVASGWPPERATDCYWYYQGCSSTEWIADQETLIYRCTQVAEEQSCQPGQQRILDL
jgi:hypothetical protein